MRYLIDVGHPAHVHYFKNFTIVAMNKGDQVLFTCRDKEVTIYLLEHYGFHYINFGRNYKSKFGKIFGLFFFTLRLFLVSVKFRPNFYLNASMYSAIVAWIFRKPHISLEDTFNMEQVNLYLPFTTCVLTGDYEHPSLGKKDIQYAGYQELLYLHPDNFRPDEKIYEELGIDNYDKYVIIRFVSWNASHDFGHTGIFEDQKINYIKEVSKICRVFISSEKKLSNELEPYRIEIPPHRMHHALAFASLVIGESFTMLSEAAMLGVPSILIHNTLCYYLQELKERYSLTYIYTESENDQRLALSKSIELLSMPDRKEVWHKRRDRMLKDKINVNAFLVWFVENFPKSMKIMQQNPEYQYKFK